MAVKDFDTTENRDRDKRSSEDWQSHHDTGKRFPDEAKGIGEVDVKNAHASGDGSFGRNDESVPEEQSDGKKEEPPY
jgi:hypothetical protein